MACMSTLRSVCWIRFWKVSPSRRRGDSIPSYPRPRVAPDTNLQTFTPPDRRAAAAALNPTQSITEPTSNDTPQPSDTEPMNRLFNVSIPKIAVESELVDSPGSGRPDTQESTEVASPYILSPQNSEEYIPLQAGPNAKGPAKGDHELMKSIYAAREECHTGEINKIIPVSKLEDLVTVTTVTKDIQSRDSSIDYDTALGYAEQVCNSAKPAKQLYATLAYIKRGKEIIRLLNENVCDEDLPLVIKTKGEVVVRRKDGRLVHSMLEWVPMKLDEFLAHQYIMIAPVLKMGAHYEFAPDIILPILKCNSKYVPAGGGFSGVFPALIHWAHHNFPLTSLGLETVFAVKRLHSHSEAEFRREEEVLVAFRDRGEKHPHIINLLATYKKDNQYHFIFPWADCNLRIFWERTRIPEFDEHTVLWSVRQMRGIAHALYHTHVFKPKNAEPIIDSISSGDYTLTVTKGEERFGMHGDVKPENMVYFETDPDNLDPGGILQLSDFGCSRFHGQHSRSNIPASTAGASATYEPPERYVQKELCRAYDLWSLGCVYLEHITWLVKGNDQIKAFGEERASVSDPISGINDDRYFTVVCDVNKPPHASLKLPVQLWVDDLHKDKKSSQLIHDLLDCIMKGLLVIDPKHRLSAEGLLGAMSKISDRAQKDHIYALRPVLAPTNSRPDSDFVAPLKPTFDQQRREHHRKSSSSIISVANLSDSNSPRKSLNRRSSIRPPRSAT